MGKEPLILFHMCTENSHIEKLPKLLEPLASKKLNLRPTNSAHGNFQGLRSEKYRALA